jgi:hypothetical protein
MEGTHNPEDNPATGFRPVVTMDNPATAITDRRPAAMAQTPEILVDNQVSPDVPASDRLPATDNPEGQLQPGKQDRAACRIMYSRTNREMSSKKTKPAISNNATDRDGNPSTRPRHLPCRRYKRTINNVTGVRTGQIIFSNNGRRQLSGQHLLHVRCPDQPRPSARPLHPDPPLGRLQDPLPVAADLLEEEAGRTKNRKTRRPDCSPGFFYDSLILIRPQYTIGFSQKGNVNDC